MSGFSGMLSFDLRPTTDASSVLDRLQVAAPALSLGGVETLVCIPARTSHRELSAAEHAALGITDGLIRVSVGIEDIADLLNDFAQALDADGQDCPRPSR